MSKNKTLGTKVKDKAKQLEAWLLSKKVVFDSLETLSKALEKLLTKHSRARLIKYINEKVEAKNLGVNAEIVRQLAVNALDSGLNPYNRDKGTNVVPRKILLDIAIEVATALVHEVGSLVSVQPMKAPVGQIFMMQFREKNKEDINGLTMKANLLDATPDDIFSPDPEARKITLEVIAQAVEAATRKLQAGWTIEAMQDMKAIHGLDIASEMVKAITAEIAQDILAEVLNDILKHAPTSDFSWTKAREADGPAYAPSFVSDTGARLVTRIMSECNDIARTTRRGCGNYIVVSPMIVSILQSSARSVFAPATEGTFRGPNNFMLVGTLNGAVKVYCHLWHQLAPGEDTILIGYKGGNGQIDAGYFYCPYIIADASAGVVVNPVTFQPTVSLMTRYGKHFMDPNYYRVLKVKDLEFV